MSAPYYDAVLWAAANGVTTGSTATAFGPDLNCTRAQIVTFLWRASGSPKPQSASHRFTDVTPGAYYEEAMLWAVEKGITTGTSETTFSPEQSCTRAQAVTFLYRTAGSPAVSGGSAFTDVPANAYYASAVQWAVQRNITTGATANTFAPEANCLRGQIVTFLYRYFAQ